MIHLVESPYLVPSVPDYALPPFVRTAEDRERWELALAIAEETSRQNEPDGQVNTQFVFGYARTIFFSDVETGSPADPSALSGPQPA
jgi:hypothetical protein